MPKVSVIIPTYNRETFICETIESVLNQTYKDFEILVIDDGSTDSTKERLEKYKNKITLIEQVNLERAVSRNEGVKKSIGKYIAFLDSDDLWINTKLEKQVEVLDKNKDFILTYNQCLRINESSSTIKTAKRQVEGYSGEIFEKLLMRNFISSPTPLIRREVLENTSGFETKYIPYEDWELWLRLSLLGKFYFINEPLTYYRIHSEQSLKSVKPERIEKITSELLLNSFTLKSVPFQIQRKAFALANLRFAYWYLLSDSEVKANEKLKKVIDLYPSFLFDPRWHGLKLLCTFPKLKEKSLFNLEQYH